MNVEKNKRTFNYLFNLFVEMGEKNFGRALTNSERSTLKKRIADKCTNIDKKDIVTQIYKLEVSKREFQSGGQRISAKEHLDIMKSVSQKTNCSPKLKLSSTTEALTSAVSKTFANFHYNNTRPYQLFTTPHSDVDKATKKIVRLTKDYNEHFHYRAPKDTSKVLKAIALGLAGVAAITTLSYSIIKNDKSSDSTKESTSISTSTEDQTLTPKTYLENSLKNGYKYSANPLLDHFKRVFTDEYNAATNSTLSCDLKIRSVPHTFIYELKNEKGKFYIAKGNSPERTKKLMKLAGYSCERIGNEYSDVNVISVTGNGNFIAAYAELDDMVPVCADGNAFTNHAPSSEELSSGYGDIINENNVAASALLIELCSTGAFDAVCQGKTPEYIAGLLKYIKNNPNSALSQKVSSAIEEQSTSTPTISTKKADDGLEIDF